MKCQYCDGTGEHINDANRMTTCEFCGGTGEVEVVGDSVTDVCDKCGGTGFFCEMRTGDVCTLGSPCPHQEPMTNEEWFCGLSTEEKAKWMFMLTYKCYWCGREYEKTKKYNEKECPFQKCLDDSKGFKKWLKEEHKPLKNDEK